MKVNKDGDYVEPCMLVPVSDIIALVQGYARHISMLANRGRSVEDMPDSYKELRNRASRKLAHFNKHTIQQ